MKIKLKYLIIATILLISLFGIIFYDSPSKSSFIEVKTLDMPIKSDDIPIKKEIPEKFELKAKIHPDIIFEEEKTEVLINIKNKEDLEEIKDIIDSESLVIGNVVSVKVSKEELQQLSEKEEIENIWPDREFSVLLDDSVQDMNIPLFWEFNFTGQGIKVAILDTGINKNHPMLEGKVILEKDFSKSISTNDGLGHGTHIAGIVAGNGQYKGVAPDVQILNGKVLSDSGFGRESYIINGINWAVENNADIISLSLGGPYPEINSPISNALRDAIDNGVVVVAASGNCGNGCPSSSCRGYTGVTTPGNTEEIITVGAVDDNKNIACFSSGENYISYIKPDVVAPGVNIISSIGQDNYVRKSGTSMSTPFISGIVALLLQQDSSLTPQQIKEKIEGNAIDLGDSGKDSFYGSGFVDVSGFEFNETIVNESVNDVNETDVNINDTAVNETIEIQDPVKLDPNSNLMIGDIAGSKFILNKTKENVNTVVYEWNDSLIILHETLLSNPKDLREFLYSTYSFTNLTSDLINSYKGYYYILFDDNYIWFKNSNIYKVRFHNQTNYDFLEYYLNLIGSDVKLNLSSTKHSLKAYEVAYLSYLENTTSAFELDINALDFSVKNINITNETGSYTIQASCGDYSNTAGSCANELSYGIISDGFYLYQCKDMSFWWWESELLCWKLESTEGDYNHCSELSSNTDLKCKQHWGDCGNNNQCKGSLNCIDGDGLNDDGCCNSNQAYDGDFCYNVCDKKWLNEYSCSGDTRKRKYQNSDCSTEWKIYETCEFDYYGSWGSDYCSGSDEDIKQERNKYIHACSSSTKACKYSTITETKTISENENSDYCDKAKGAGCACESGEGDCDDGECASGYFCDSDYNAWSTDYCCPTGSKWDGSKCVVQCSISNAYWKQTSAVEGETVELKVETSGCDGKTASFTVYEQDSVRGILSNETIISTLNISINESSNLSNQVWGPPDDSEFTQPSSKTIRNNIATTTWISFFQENDGLPPWNQYYFDVEVDGKTLGSSNDLTVKDDCIITSANWNQTSVRAPDYVTLEAFTEGCEGDMAIFTIYKSANLPDLAPLDNRSNSNETYEIIPTSTAIQLIGQVTYGYAWVHWPSEYDDSQDGYYFTVKIDDKEKRSGSLSVLHGCYNENDEYVCKDHEECISNRCVQKTCEEMEMTNCYNFLESECIPYSNGHPYDCDYFGTSLCWKSTDTCKPTQRCDNNGFGNSKCTDREECDDENIDFDNDKHNKTGCGGLDCNDTNPFINPNASERCDDIDWNCDGNKTDGFDLKSDNNNCGSCGNVCENSGCRNGNCEQFCGDGYCNNGETFYGCEEDCGSKFDVSIIEQITPAKAKPGDEVTFSAKIKNIGLREGGIFIEGGIVPDSWVPDVGTAEVIDNPVPVCEENEFYDSKLVELDVGEETYVEFTVNAPTEDSVDACNDLGTAWDEFGDFVIVVGTYKRANRESYVDSIKKGYTVTKDLECNHPYGTANCSCNDKEKNPCRDSENCVKNKCVPQDSACIFPFGSENCQCHSDAQCEFHGNYSCSKDQKFNRCLPKDYTHQCDFADQLKCDGNAVYRCENNSKYLDWNYVNGCSSRQICTTGGCVSKGDYDLIIDSAPESVSVNVVSETILKLNVKIKNKLDQSLSLEYDQDNFRLISGPCESQDFTIGNNVCYFNVDSLVGQSYLFSYGDDSQRVNVLGRDPFIVYVTDKDQLEKRYKDKTAVQLLLAKLYEEAYENDGVVVDLPTQFVKETIKHPFSFLFNSYSERRNNPKYNDNSYTDRVSLYLTDYFNEAKNIVIVGDDYVVPHRRDIYSLDKTGLSHWLIGLYDYLSRDVHNPKYDAFKDYIPKNIVLNSMFTDQHLVQRKVDFVFSELDTVFSNDHVVRTTQIKFVVPDNIDSEMETAIKNLKQELINSNLADPKEQFQMIKGSTLTCDDFSEFGDWWWFDALDVPIVIGTTDTNPALSCFPVYSNSEHSIDMISLEPSVWNGNGVAVVLNTNNHKTVDHFANAFIKDRQFKELKDKDYMILHDALELGGIVVGVASIPVIAARGGLATIAWVVDTGFVLAEASDNCLYRYSGDVHEGGSYKLECGLSTLPLGLGGIGLGAKYGLGKLATKKFLTAASKGDPLVNVYAKMFAEIGQGAEQAIRSIPENKYDDFFKILHKTMKPMKFVERAQFSESLSAVILKSNLKKSDFSPELFEAISDVVNKQSKDILGKSSKHLDRDTSKHLTKQAKKELDGITSGIASIVVKEEGALPALNIIRKTDGVWTRAELDELSKMDTKSIEDLLWLIKQFDKCFGASVNLLYSLDVGCGYSPKQLIKHLKRLHGSSIVKTFEDLAKQIPNNQIYDFIKNTDDALNLAKGNELLKELNLKFSDFEPDLKLDLRIEHLKSAGMYANILKRYKDFLAKGTENVHRATITDPNKLYLNKGFKRDVGSNVDPIDYLTYNDKSNKGFGFIGTSRLSERAENSAVAILMKKYNEELSFEEKVKLVGKIIPVYNYKIKARGINLLDLRELIFSSPDLVKRLDSTTLGNLNAEDEVVFLGRILIEDIIEYDRLDIILYLDGKILRARFHSSYPIEKMQHFRWS